MPVISTTREATTIADIGRSPVIVAYKYMKPDRKIAWRYTLLPEEMPEYRRRIEDGKIACVSGRRSDDGRECLYAHLRQTVPHV